MFHIFWCSRPSFFGGAVSTRHESSATTWKPPKPEPPPRTHSKASAARKATNDRTTAAATSALPVDPVQQQRERIKKQRDFSGLDSDETPAPPTKPAPSAKPRSPHEQAQHSQAKQRQQGGGRGAALAARHSSAEDERRASHSHASPSPSPTSRFVSRFVTGPNLQQRRPHSSAAAGEYPRKPTADRGSASQHGRQAAQQQNGVGQGGAGGGAGRGVHSDTAWLHTRGVQQTQRVAAKGSPLPNRKKVPVVPLLQLPTFP